MFDLRAFSHPDRVTLPSLLNKVQNIEAPELRNNTANPRHRTEIWPGRRKCKLVPGISQDTRSA